MGLPERYAETCFDLAAQATIERRRRWNWFLLITTSTVSTGGVALAVLPLLDVQVASVWPWSYTNHALLAGLSLCLVALALYLTQQEKRLIGFRMQLLEAQREILEEQVARRIAEARRQAEDLRRSKQWLEEQNASLRRLHQTAYQFVDTVSHEFRTPLTVIKEHAEAMLEGLDAVTNAEHRLCLETIVRRTDDLSVLVDDLLDTSRIEADVLRTARRSCRLEDIVRRAGSILERKAAAAQIHLEYALDADLPAVYCDPEKIGRVLVNLGVNAVKFSARGAAVRLWTQRSQDDRELIVGVTDHGPGIAPEHQKMIFERFRQLDAQARSSTRGFGLGLSIVKELVHLNFGTLSVDSEPGRGSTFSFTLPRAEPATLLTLYLQRIRRLREDVQHVALLRGAVDAGAAGASRLEIQNGIEANVRRSDLVVPAADSTWLLVAATREPQVDELIDRLEQVRELPDRAPSVLPPMHWIVEGCWRLDGEGPEFVARFLGLCARLDASVADPQAASTAAEAARGCRLD